MFGACCQLCNSWAAASFWLCSATGSGCAAAGIGFGALGWLLGSVLICSRALVPAEALGAVGVAGAPPGSAAMRAAADCGAAGAGAGAACTCVTLGLLMAAAASPNWFLRWLRLSASSIAMTGYLSRFVPRSLPAHSATAKPYGGATRSTPPRAGAGHAACAAHWRRAAHRKTL